MIPLPAIIAIVILLTVVIAAAVWRARKNEVPGGTTEGPPSTSLQPLPVAGLFGPPGVIGAVLPGEGSFGLDEVAPAGVAQTVVGEMAPPSQIPTLPRWVGPANMPGRIIVRDSKELPAQDQASPALARTTHAMETASPADRKRIEMALKDRERTRAAAMPDVTMSAVTTNFNFMPTGRQAQQLPLPTSPAGMKVQLLDEEMARRRAEVESRTFRQGGFGDEKARRDAHVAMKQAAVAAARTGGAQPAPVASVPRVFTAAAQREIRPELAPVLIPPDQLQRAGEAAYLNVALRGPPTPAAPQQGPAARTMAGRLQKKQQRAPQQP